MTSTDVLAPSVTMSERVRSLDVPACLGLTSEAMEVMDSGSAYSAVHDPFSASRFAEVGKNALLNVKIDRQDVAAGLYHVPVDRGPKTPPPAPAELTHLLKSWQYQATGKLGAAQVLHEMGAIHIKHGGPAGIRAEALKYISERNMDDTFYVVDLANVLRMHKAWRGAMPRVMPFYAVKCYPEPGLLKLLIALGTGFDCASKGECEMMLKMGVHPSRIIFAHPCKRPCDIRYAREQGIDYTTFDTESELHKIAALHPGFKLVLRIRADDPDARVPLGLKYGCLPEEAAGLLATAQSLGLNVVGVSFHVGSACKNLAAYSGAIEKARMIFDTATAMGYEMELLDIGGGFTGHFDSHGNVMFGDIANAINSAIAAHFPPESGVRIISEPGRYFAETASTLLTPIYGQRDRVNKEGVPTKEYWLTDGLYGSFNCIIYDGQNPTYEVVRSPQLPEFTNPTEYNSTLWGPTCDSADCVYKDVPLPQLRNGDWLMFPNSGAYTVAGACDFNGIEFTTPNKFYVFSDSAVDADAEVEGQEVQAMDA